MFRSLTKAREKEVSQKRHTQQWYPKDKPLGIGSSRVFEAQPITKVMSVPLKEHNNAPLETNVEGDHFI